MKHPAQVHTERRRGLAALLLATATLSLGATTAKSLDKVTFRVTKHLSSAVAHIAEAEGFFAAEGLEVEMVYWSNASDMLPSLAHGKIDVSTTGHLGAAYVNVINRGARIRLVAARTVHATDGCGYFSFVARRELVDSGQLNDPSSLRGLRIATDRTSSSYYYWARLLKMAGLGLHDVKVRDVPNAAKPDALAKGLIDVCSQTEPWTSRMVRSGHGRIWRPVSDILPNHQSTFVVFGRRLLDDDRDLGRRFMAAYMKAARQYVEEGKSERHIEIVARQTKIDPQELREMCWPQWSVDGRIDDRSLEEFQLWALEEGLIDAVVPVTDLVDEGFLPSAVELASRGLR